MTGVFITRDPDPARRTRAVERAATLLRATGRPVIGSLERGEVAVVWGSQVAMPTDTHEADDHAVFLLGDVLAAGGRLSAHDYGRRWAGRPGPPDPYDGLHLAVLVGGDGRISVDADLLGLVPVYHAVVGDQVIVATGPELLACHESYAPKLDPWGLTAVLLLDALLNGRTPYQGVRRLAAGHVLLVDPGARPREVLTYAPPASDALHDEPRLECARQIHDSMTAAVRRHAQPGRRHGLLLSGGRDSRLMAGMLVREGVTAEAITYGVPTDLEARYARRVARILGMPHALMPDPEDEREFERILRWEGLVSTPSVAVRQVDGRVDALISGHLMDTTWALSDVAWAYDPEKRITGVEPYFAQLNRHAIDVDDLGQLLSSSPFDGAIGAVQDAFEQEFQAAGASQLERVWRSGMRLRGRFWVGSSVWSGASDCWPSMPHLDREVLATVGSVPLAFHEERQLQDQILIDQYPELASVPVDHTSFETHAVRPRLADLLRNSAERRARYLLQKVHVRLPETRVNTRTLEIGREGWREVRVRLEPMRPLAHDLFDPATFDRLLPPPGEPVPGRATYPDSSGAKMLLAVLSLLQDGITV